jgi:hypothetical protein
MTGYRVRVAYLALAAGTIAIGLAVHFRGDALRPALRDFTGDALWAAMVVWLLAAAVPRLRLPLLAFTALAISYVVEFGQLYRSPAIDALRATTVGHLVLGSGFDPRDLVAYAVGVLAAVLLDRAVIRGRRQSAA